MARPSDEPRRCESTNSESTNSESTNSESTNSLGTSPAPGSLWIHDNWHASWQGLRLALVMCTRVVPAGGTVSRCGGVTSFDTSVVKFISVNPDAPDGNDLRVADMFLSNFGRIFIPFSARSELGVERSKFLKNVKCVVEAFGERFQAAHVARSDLVTNSVRGGAHAR